jgi:hypothetical protein
MNSKRRVPATCDILRSHGSVAHHGNVRPRCSIQPPGAGEAPALYDYGRRDASGWIGATATIFTWIKAVLLAPVPGVAQPEQLVKVLECQAQ